MIFLLAVVVAAALLGAFAPLMFKSRPRLALSAVVFLPPLLLLVRYLTFVRSHDWEGMGGAALSIMSFGWIIISFVSGVAVLKVRNRETYGGR